MERVSKFLSSLGLLALGSLVGCVSHPSDRQMIAEFHANEGMFQRLMQSIDKDTASGLCPPEFAAFPDPNQARNLPIETAKKYRVLMDNFCPKCDVFRSLDGNIKLLVSAEGMLKGSYKGYAYGAVQPSKVVADLDNVRPAKLNDCDFHYRPVAREWYLYYQGCF